MSNEITIKCEECGVKLTIPPGSEGPEEFIDVLDEHGWAITEDGHLCPDCIAEIDTHD